MRHGGGFRFLAALFFIGFVGLFTLGAFGVGIAVGAGSSGTAFAGWGHGSIIGILLTILIFVILLRMIGFMIFGHHRHWARHAYFNGGFDGDRCGPGSFGPGFGRRGPGFGRRGPGFGPHGRGFGPGDWQKSEWREVGQAYFDEFHRRSHETGPAAADGAPTTDQPK